MSKFEQLRTRCAGVSLSHAELLESALWHSVEFVNDAVVVSMLNAKLEYLHAIEPTDAAEQTGKNIELYLTNLPGEVATLLVEMELAGAIDRVRAAANWQKVELLLAAMAQEQTSAILLPSDKLQ